MNLHYNGDESYLYVRFANLRRVTRYLDVNLFRRRMKRFTKDEMSVITRNRPTYNFSIDSSAIEKGYVQNTPCLSHPPESTPESCSVKIWSMKSLRGENFFKFLPPRQIYII